MTIIVRMFDNPKQPGLSAQVFDTDKLCEFVVPMDEKFPGVIASLDRGKLPDVPARHFSSDEVMVPHMTLTLNRAVGQVGQVGQAIAKALSQTKSLGL